MNSTGLTKTQTHNMFTYRTNSSCIHFAAGPVRNISKRRIPIEEEAAMGDIAKGW